MCDVSYVQPRDDADVRRADAMTSLDHADGQMMIAGTEQMKNLAATDARKSPRHISKLAGRTPVEQRSSDRRSEPDAETGQKHAQQVDDAPIINHARKPSESSGVGGHCSSPSVHGIGSDGRRANLSSDAVWQFDGTIFVDTDRNDVSVTALVKLDESRVRLNIDYYSYDLEQDFHESVDLPINVILELAERLRNLKKGDAP